MDMRINGPMSIDLFESTICTHNSSTIETTTVDEWNSWRKKIHSDSFLSFKLEDGHLTSADLLERAVDSIKARLIEGYNCVVAFSGGKDSSLVLHAFILACMELKREGKLNLIEPCGILHSNTLIENPEAHNLAMDAIEEIVSFAQKEGIPLVPIIASPTLQSSWVGRVLGGRGIPIFVNSQTRDCATDWKIKAGVSAVNHWSRSLGYKKIKDFRSKKLLTLLGSRIGESVKRDTSLAKLGSDDRRIVRNKDGEAFLYPIMHFDEDRLWAVLTKTGRDALIPSARISYDDLYEFYSEGSGGDCQLVAAPSEEDVVSSEEDVTGEFGRNGACSSRSGCILCTAVSDDKSTLQMIESNRDKYGYMEHLNRIQQALSLSQYNWNLRGGVGRTLYSNGYLELKHDTYCISFLRRLLHALISADFLEEQRAEAHLIKLERQQIPDTPRNQRMSRPQFCFITPEVIVYLDFIWSLHGYSSEPFIATQTYKSVYENGELELFDDLDELYRQPTKRINKKYLRVTPEGGFWDQGEYVVNSIFRLPEQGLHEYGSQAESSFDDLSEYEETDSMYLAIDSGLADADTLCSSARNEMFDPHSHQELSLVGSVAESASIQFNLEYWDLFVSDMVTRYIDDPHVSPLTACKVFLKIGLVELPKGQLLNRHYQALRGQTLHYNRLTSDRSVEQILIDADNGLYRVKSGGELGMFDTKGSLTCSIQRRRSKLPFKVRKVDESQISLF
ncbi:hypothetical protein L1D14_10450 [Vibrio tubiashii]|uniref:hypothetical protein n=1 Tax=Vibrio tubiashii TaxID=29498 RepID=UPI001EFDC373|nr:hypothetical protein [Vibrio tubiashii]MCG9576657.1 hypothetical protein [Vibrio tubiashii]